MSERLSDDDLDRLEALAWEATPPPWLVAHEDAMSPTDVPVLAEGGYLCASPDDGVRGGHLRADAEFIAAARNALPALLAEVREHRLAQGAERGGGDRR